VDDALLMSVMNGFADLGKQGKPLSQIELLAEGKLWSRSTWP
jgi:hypothetical protein